MSAAGDECPARKLPNALRCVGCGYDLSGLDPLGFCPECGVGIDASLRAHLGGTAWQRSPSYRTWIETAWLLTRDPSAVAQVNSDLKRPRTLHSNLWISTACAWPYGLFVMVMWGVAARLIVLVLVLGVLWVVFLVLWKLLVRWTSDRPRSARARGAQQMTGHIIFPFALTMFCASCFIGGILVLISVGHMLGVNRGVPAAWFDAAARGSFVVLLLPVWGAWRSLRVRKAARAHVW